MPRSSFDESAATGWPRPRRTGARDGRHRLRVATGPADEVSTLVVHAARSACRRPRRRGRPAAPRASARRPCRTPAAAAATDAPGGPPPARRARPAGVPATPFPCRRSPRPRRTAPMLRVPAARRTVMRQVVRSQSMLCVASCTVSRSPSQRAGRRVRLHGVVVLERASCTRPRHRARPERRPASTSPRRVLGIRALLALRLRGILVPPAEVHDAVARCVRRPGRAGPPRGRLPRVSATTTAMGWPL